VADLSAEDAGNPVRPEHEAWRIGLGSVTALQLSWLRSALTSRGLLGASINRCCTTIGGT
jgi:hypothetical protein